MNTIQSELNAAKEFMLDTITTTDGKTIAALSRKNVALVEAMIQNDSAYLKSFDKNAKPIYNRKGEITYSGSTAYWMTKLKQILLDNQTLDEEFERVIENAVKAVDRENSTHLNADKVGRSELAERIIKAKANLLKYLRDPDGTELQLIKIISASTTADERPRKNVSFASKFCHYACFFLFEGQEEQDNYSIYDNVMKKTLPLYMAHYGSSRKKDDLDDYGLYREVVDEIINKSGSGISRNGFDHILWYYFKGRPERNHSTIP